MSDLQKKIIAIVAHYAVRPETAILLSSRFKEDLGMDSLDCIDMVMVLEAEFMLEISEEDVASFLTVQDAVHFIQSHTNLAHSA